MKNVLIILLLISNYVSADTTLMMKTFGGNDESEIYIKKGQLRFVMQANKDKKRISIFSKTDNKIMVLNEKLKTFLVMDEQVINAQKAYLAQRLKLMVKQLKSNFDKVLPAKQAKIKAFLKNVNPVTGELIRPKITFVPTGKFAEVSHFICERVSVYFDKVLTKELCLADEKALKMDVKDFETLKAFFAFMKKTNAQSQNESIPELKGIPIATKGLKGQTSSGLQWIKYDELSDALFQVPLGFKQVNMK